MSASMFLFVTAMLVGAAFLAALMWAEWDVQWSGFKQVGESSLSRNSINWLGGIAFVAALSICLLAK